MKRTLIIATLLFVTSAQGMRTNLFSMDREPKKILEVATEILQKKALFVPQKLALLSIVCNKGKQIGFIEPLIYLISMSQKKIPQKSSYGKISIDIPKYKFLPKTRMLFVCTLPPSRYIPQKFLVSKTNINNVNLVGKMTTPIVARLTALKKGPKKNKPSFDFKLTINKKKSEKTDLSKLTIQTGNLHLKQLDNLENNLLKWKKDSINYLRMLNDKSLCNKIRRYIDKNIKNKKNKNILYNWLYKNSLHIKYRLCFIDEALKVVSKNKQIDFKKLYSSQKNNQFLSSMVKIFFSN